MGWASAEVLLPVVCGDTTGNCLSHFCLVTHPLWSSLPIWSSKSFIHRFKALTQNAFVKEYLTSSKMYSPRCSMCFLHSECLHWASKSSSLWETGHIIYLYLNLPGILDAVIRGAKAAVEEHEFKAEWKMEKQANSIGRNETGNGHSLPNSLTKENQDGTPLLLLLVTL